jgi:tetratricopeptide (TPR) repeat protein
MALSKKEHTLMVLLIIVLILGVGGTIVLKDKKGASAAQDSNGVSTQEVSHEKQKSMLQAMEKQLSQNSNDINLRVELANQYYDLASGLRGSNQDESIILFNQAVSHYKEVLKSTTDINVLVDMATAAYYGKDNATAEETFKKAIQLDPKFYHARYNYGVFLFHAKGDMNGALQEWKTALTLNPSPQDTERLKNLISGLEEEIAASGSKS